MFARTLQPGFFASLARVFQVPPATDTPDTTQERRDFILAAMDGSPEAFASEADVQAMMFCYHGRL